MQIKNKFKEKDLQLNCLDFNFVAQNQFLIAKLRKLTLYPFSGMNFELNELSRRAKFRKVNCKILTARVNDELVGWALLSKEPSQFNFENGRFDYTKGYMYQVYVTPKLRGMGIGSCLMKIAKRKVNGADIYVAPHDKQSKDYFKKFPTCKKL